VPRTSICSMKKPTREANSYAYILLRDDMHSRNIFRSKIEGQFVLAFIDM
jgi:uncharacterized protein YcgL (UPF0745 family)